jgi:hypothetical protein
MAIKIRNRKTIEIDNEHRNGKTSNRATSKELLPLPVFLILRARLCDVITDLLGVNFFYSLA